MSERLFDSQRLQKSALAVVNRLNEVAINRERTYPSSIKAVLVFSGPGTNYDRLKPGQEEWMAWMDRDRIRAGVAVAREVTATAMSEALGRRIRTDEVTPGDVEKYGPYFVYNGIPLENKVFREALTSEVGKRKLPKSKVLIIDEVRENGFVDIAHTAHQVKSFYQELGNPQSPLHGIENVALVAHIPDFVRIPFYTKKYNDEFIESGGHGLRFWAYGLIDRKGSAVPHTESELPKLVTYAERGHLAIEPSPLSF
ncbi:MAG: hypothetical protein HY428_02285 [Candidatus Levybacteria bacterium]|nr:hypothetical protein [Candidatus Levybacteria bacterium]